MKTVVAAAAMGTLLLIVRACSQQAAPSGSNAFSTQDRTFLNVIGQSTLAEVALGKLAAQKGKTPAVRLFGRWMASTDSLANRQLATMMTELNGPTLPTTPTAEQQAEFQKMEALSDAEFDREYILDAAVTKQAGGPIDRGANDVTMAQANLDLNREESSMPLRDDMSHKVQRQQPSDDSDISIGFHVPLLRPIVVRGGGDFP